MLRQYPDRAPAYRFLLAALEQLGRHTEVRFYARRSEWFEHFDGPYFVMWRVPAGHRPSVEEAVARLNHLKEHGTSDYAFDWQTAPAQLWKTARCAPGGQVA